MKTSVGELQPLQQNEKRNQLGNPESIGEEGAMSRRCPPNDEPVVAKGGDRRRLQLLQDYDSITEA